MVQDVGVSKMSKVRNGDLNMPEQLKYPGRVVGVEAENVDDNFDIFMWGKPVRIVSFATMMP